MNRIIVNRDILKDFLSYEKKLYGNQVGGIWSLFPITEYQLLWKHQYILRKCEYHVNCGHKIRGTIFRVRLHRIQNRIGIHIPINVCDRGLKIMHVGPVLMNHNAHIGKDCKFHINTAVVAGGTNDLAPSLGDNIVVGIGAVILGGTHVSSGVAIGANAVVNKDVTEENVTVAGVPARIISHSGRASWDRRDRHVN